MPRKPKTIDTNLIVRFLTADDPSKANAVEKLLKKTEKNELEIPDVIIAEIVWVLLSFYELTKADVIEKLEGLLSLENVKMNRAVLEKTIDIYRRYTLSYTDAYLIAYSLEKGSSVIYSFDQGLNKVREVRCLQP